MSTCCALIGFDLDNTLARSRKPMKADMAECFSALTSLIDVAVITGGKYSLLQSQVVDRLSDHADKSKLHLMPTSRNRYYRWDGQRWGKVFSHDPGQRTVPRQRNRWNGMLVSKAFGPLMSGASASRTEAVRSPFPHRGSLPPSRPRRLGTPPTRRRTDWPVRLLPNYRILK